MENSLYPLLLSLLITVPLIRESVGENRIANGTAVNPPHKYPWMVSLYYGGCLTGGAGYCPYDHFCGGSVINEYYVLTAAHCCFGDYGMRPNASIKDVYVITGLHKRNKLQPWSQNLSIAECIVHEQNELGGSQMHDVALIRIKGKIEMSDKVTPVNLPPVNFDVEKDGELTASLIGWGHKDLNGTLGEELQEVQLPVITTDTCQRWHGFSQVYGRNTSFEVTDSMICVGGVDTGKGGCLFDSGSPLMILNAVTKTYTQIGIHGWSLPPCATSYSVSQRVSSYLSWINHHLQQCRPRNFDSTDSH